MKYPEPEPDHGHAFADSSNRYPRDAYPREHGFRIHSRKKGQQPEWERGGLVIAQSDALRIASSEEEYQGKRRCGS